jgi:hypothetical protein
VVRESKAALQQNLLVTRFLDTILKPRYWLNAGEISQRFSEHIPI